MFYFDKVLGKEVLKSDFLHGVNHFFTTKELLLKTKEEENIQIANNNRRDLKTEFNLKSIVTPSQRHTANIETADINKDNYPECDGLMLKDKNLGIFLNFADCTPIIFYDVKNKIGAISHAGWRGTAQKIGPKTIDLLKDKFNSKPKNIVALIGPCICFDCFETGEEVVEQLALTVDDISPYKKIINNKSHLDLKGINEEQLKNAGVEKIDIAPYCTCCNNDRFYSHRHENKTTNRMSAFLSLN